MIKVAINGFGRIGRAVFKIVSENNPDMEIVAVNDLADPESLAHLVKYDSVYGIFSKNIRVEDGFLILNEGSEEKRTKLFFEKDPANLPWKELEVDVVLECTGIFRDYNGANKHIEAGARKVIISAPSKEPEKIPSYVMGINEKLFDDNKDHIIDMGSCTTNCLAPVVKVLNDEFGFKKGFMTTIHSYTNDQRILDLMHSDLRRARAAAMNIIPTTTGAARAIGWVIPELKGKIDGYALRVPTPTVSVLDLSCEIEKQATKEEINSVFVEASLKENYKGILDVESKPLVSSDYIGNTFSSIVDSSFTMADKGLVKIMAWYDNEWGYSCRLADLAKYIAKK